VSEIDVVTARLADAGFLAARDEAEELVSCAHDKSALEPMLVRRLGGEPLAWITGFTTFCGLKVRVGSGVYVPRWQSEPLARRAVARLPANGVAIDLCTGSGAIAMVLLDERPDARIVASDVDDRSVACAASNGVAVFRGDLFSAFPLELEGIVDVIVGVVPYVPTSSLRFLARDTLAFESSLSYDGGPDGTDILRRVVAESSRFLRPGGALLLELGGDEVDVLQSDLARHRFTDLTIIFDDDGDVRGIETTLSA
jgi:release factor glutamine methyltransferase